MVSRSRYALVALLAVASLSARALSAQDLTPLVRLDPPGETVQLGVLSPDGRTVAMRTSDGVVRRIYIGPVEGGSANPVVGPLLPAPLTGSLNLFFTPDGERLVYSTSTTSGHFSVPIDLSQTAVQLSGPVGTGGQIRTLQVSPDGGWAVFEQNPDSSSPNELYSIPIDASVPAVKLNAPPVAPSPSASWKYLFTPNGATVVYFGKQDSATVAELYAVPVDGSALPVKLSLPGGASVTEAIMIPDGSRVAYVAGGVLYGVPVDGSAAAIQLSTTLNGLGANVSGPVVSPDNSRIVYRQAHVPPKIAVGLFSVPTGGGPVLAYAAGHDYIPEVRISPDSQYVLWSQANTDDFDFPPPLTWSSYLESCPLALGSQHALTVDVCFDTEPATFGIQFSRDSTSFAGYEPQPGCGYITTGPVYGTPRTYIAIPPGTVGTSFFTVIYPGDEYVYYTARASGTPAAWDVWSSPADGTGQAVQISPIRMFGGSGSLQFSMSSNGRCLLIPFNDGASSGLYSTCLAVRLASISPNAGPLAGGTTVRVRGSGFSPESRVFFDGIPASSTQLVNETTLLAVTPSMPGRAGMKHLFFAELADVTVTDVGTKATLATAFTFRH